MSSVIFTATCKTCEGQITLASLDADWAHVTPTAAWVDGAHHFAQPVPGSALSTEPVRHAHAELVERTVQANAAWCAPVSIDYRWSTLETLVDGEWHPVPLVSITWDNGNTVSVDDYACTVAAIRLAREVLVPCA